MAHVCIELDGTGRDGKGITITITRGRLGSSRAQWRRSTPRWHDTPANSRYVKEEIDDDVKEEIDAHSSVNCDTYSAFFSLTRGLSVCLLA